MSLSARERGRLVRALAEREHFAPDGRRVRVTRNTLDRWIRAYREGGFDGLVPAPRRVANSTPERLLELAVALRREQPARTAAQIHRIIVEAEGAAPSARTIQRHLAAAGLPWKGSPDRACAGAVRGRVAQRVVDRGRVARPADRRSPRVPVLLHRRSQPAAGRLPVGRAGGRAERLPRAARRDRRTRPAEGRLRRQRQPVRVRPAAAGVRGARDPPDPLHARTAGGAREDRTRLSDGSRAAAGRARGPPAREP